MDPKEMLETLSGLKLFALRNPAERKHFAGYMTSFGLYIGFNVLCDIFLHKNLWFPTIFIAFFLATLQVTGWIFGLITWSLIGAFCYFLTKFFYGIPVRLAIFALIFTGIFITYWYGEKKGTLKGLLPLKMSLSGKVGMSWGVIMGGMHVVFLALQKEGFSQHIATLLYGYATGVGLFISGIIAEGYFLLGIVGILGIPIFYTFNPLWSYILLGLLGWASFLYSLKLLFKKV